MKKAAPVSTCLLASMLVATGCMSTDVDTPRVSNDDAIHLDVTTTRASVSTVTDMHPGFRVFAASGDVASTHEWYPGIDGTNNHLYSGGQWQFATPVSWPTDAGKYPMTFYAWYPVDGTAGGPVLSADDPAATPIELQGTVTVQPKAADQVDFLVSKSIAVERPAGGNLSMTFEHALSKIDFGIIPGREVNAEILSLGVLNVGNTRTYDFIAGGWASAQPDLSSVVAYDYYGNFLDATFGGGAFSSTAWSPGVGDDETTGVPFYNASTSPAAADAHLMLMPQTNPSWDPAAAPTMNVGDGAAIVVLYRMTTFGGVDEVGFASARNHPDFVQGGYEGPLYVAVGFPLPADANGDFTWTPGKGYTYNIGLGTSGASNGYVLSTRYFDENGQMSFELTGGLDPGDPLNDGVIHIDLDVDVWGDEDGGELIGVNPNIIDPQAPYIIYWDDATQTMQVSSWNAVAGGAVKTENQLFFQFGGTVGFLNQNDSWDASDIKFNVTSTTDYTSLPDWSDYTGTKSTTDGYISTADYHNAANVQAGYGDPCKLVGLTVEQVKAGIIDNNRFRMATLAANGGASNWTVYGTRPASGTLNTTWGVMSSAGTFLPGSSSRTTAGAPYQVGRSVFFWNSQANDGTTAKILDVNPTISVGGTTDTRNGIPVRCIGQAPYSVSATLNYDAVPNSGGTVKITSDVAGTIPITEAVEGQSVTFTLVPADPATTTFGAWYLGNNRVRLNTNDTHLNPITITMPGSPVTVDGVLGTFAPSGGVTIPHDANGLNGAVWAREDLISTGAFDGLRQLTGAFFQWGRDVAYENQADYDVMYGYSPTMNPTPGYPQTPGSDQTGATTWPEATDPCPDGWHLPTSGEWQRFLDATTDPLSGSTRPFYLTDNSDYILLNANGYITDQGLGISYIDSNGNTNPLFGGYFWASDSNSGDSARASYFYWEGDLNPAALADDALKTNAYKVRCVQDLPTPPPNPVGEVVVGDIAWAMTNVATPGTFAATMDVYDGANQYNFDEAQTVCPAGWRLPTSQEYYDLMAAATNAGGSTGDMTPAGAGWYYSNPGWDAGDYSNSGMLVETNAGDLFFSASGTASDSGSEGSTGYYWSGYKVGADVYALLFASTQVRPGASYNNPDYIMSVRCVRDL